MNLPARDPVPTDPQHGPHASHSRATGGRAGDRASDVAEHAPAELVDAIYAELKRLAHHCARAEGGGRVIQPTSLLHDVYLKLANVESIDWANRGQVLGTAALLMRRALVDRARRRGAAKRGGDRLQVPIDAAGPALAHEGIRVLELDDSLSELSSVDPRASRVVEMRFFGGMTLDEIAQALGVSARTAEEDWRFARAWLRAELEER